MQVQYTVTNTKVVQGYCIRMEHCIIIWIYFVFTIIQIWCTCVCKYCICDISAIVNESFIFTIVLMSDILYFLTPLHHINKYIANANYYAVLKSGSLHEEILKLAAARSDC